MEKFLKIYGGIVAALLILAIAAMLVFGIILVAPGLSGGTSSSLGEGLGNGFMLIIGVLDLILCAFVIAFTIPFIIALAQTKKKRDTRVVDLFMLILFAVLFVAGIVLAAMKNEYVLFGVAGIVLSVLIEIYAIPAVIRDKRNAAACESNEENEESVSE